MPLSYAGSEVAECNHALMPEPVTGYGQAARCRDAAIGREPARTFSDRGVVLLTWIWQSGSIASRTRPILLLEGVRGVKIRGGGREMDLAFQAARATVPLMTSNEMYTGMQTGTLDAAVNLSATRISFRLRALTRHLTAGRGHSFYFNPQPLIVSKAVLDALSPRRQVVVRTVGRSRRRARSRPPGGTTTNRRGSTPSTARRCAIWRATPSGRTWRRGARTAELRKLAEQVS